MWTIASIKAALPDVAVQIQGQTYRATVHGRLEPFATVNIPIPTPELPYPVALTWEVAWTTIARSLNTNRPIEG